jgi:hypothetical protein
MIEMLAPASEVVETEKIAERGELLSISFEDEHEGVT